MTKTLQQQTGSILALRIVTGALAGLGVRAVVVWAAGPETLGGPINIVLSLVAGAMLALAIFESDPRVGPSMAWGLAFGLASWCATLVADPILRTRSLDWSVGSIGATVPTLVAYVLMGLIVSVALPGLVNLRRLRAKSAARQALLGSVAGLVSLVGYRLAAGSLAVGHLAEVFDLPLASAPLLGLAFGAVYALLFWHEMSGHGFSIGWGLTLALAAWLIVTLTLIPLASMTRLDWSVAGIQATIPGLVSLLLYGTFTGVACLTLTRLWQTLFADGMVRARADEGLGARSVRAVLWGSLASVAGGLAFSIVMVWLGVLPIVAQLVGGSTAVVGFVVHMVISTIIGATYGLLFRRESATLGAGIAWGLVYGFVWWLLGMLTLMPRLLGEPIAWAPGNLQGSFASLVGHLAYGASTALVFQLLANRYTERRPSLRARSRPADGFAAAAPLWASILVLAVLLPLLLAP